MRLHELKNTKGAVHRRKRLGCGESSGQGKTSGRGHKGMKARSGGSVRPGFEGGQMPLYRKLPHRGFNAARFTTRYEIVNTGDIAKLTDKEVDRMVLINAGLVRKNNLPLKVLGNGELSASVTVTANAFSASAKQKIEAAGGTVVLIGEG